MVNVSAICFVLFCISLKICVAMPYYEEDRFSLDKDYMRQLVERLADQQSPMASSDIYSIPCRPCFYPNYPIPSEISISHNPYAKRNSELINSLLSLPKSMNDAGK
ncbi:protein PDF isoform X2 [Toxorhynchites rutilus septentrionalis]|uniref:protein PDF isoform X2 n=1 Tax=Toxorhynchites rutilus septentrionalis TaxID=329112 RepID=UPI00247AEE29|nr:protein PDF isoform X2 [Toxorhynchites rutilus septentrionalis]